MSHVSSMILTCNLIEEDDDGGLAALQAWCQQRQRRPVRFGRLDDRPGHNGKAMQVLILCAAVNYFDEDELLTAFPTFPWLFPETAVLVIHTEHDGLRIATGQGVLHDTEAVPYPTTEEDQ